MSTVMKGSSEKRQNIERPRLKRLAEAHVLAAAIFDYYYERREFDKPLEERAGDSPISYHSIPGFPKKNPRAEFQKGLIYDWADRLGFEIHSRKELTAEQLGRVCSALRARMQELGIAEPEQNRPPERATADQYRMIYAALAKVEALPGWGGRRHSLNFIHRQSGRRSLRRLTRGQADALLRGLDGILRHAKGDSCQKP